jgi:hypothetical protein
MAVDWGAGASGAGQGAAAGSVAGPWGTAIGAGAGFILGSGMLNGPGAKFRKQYLNVNPEDQQRQLAMREQQGMWDVELQRRAMGQGPSVAGLQQQASIGQSINAARSQAASARGGNPALAQRTAGLAQANAISQGSRDAAMLRAQEMQNAGQTYAGQLEAQRGADLQARGLSIQEGTAQLDADQAREAQLHKIGSEKKGMFGLSDIRAKENIKPLYSDFNDKENPQPVLPSFGQQLAMLNQPQQQRPMAPPAPLAPLQSTQPEQDSGPKKDDTGDMIKTGMQLYGMFSDKHSKEKIQELKTERDAFKQAASREAVRSHMDRVPSMWNMPTSALRTEGDHIQPQAPLPQVTPQMIAPQMQPPPAAPPANAPMYPERVAMASDYTNKELISSETTHLTDSEEQAFRTWARENNIKDVDHPDAHYDYRGFWKDNGGPRIRGGVDHFPDTYKQHGHPTFSVESKYSSGDEDGGHWQGERFIPGSGAAAAYPGDDLDRVSRESNAQRVGQVEYPVTAEQNRQAFAPIRPVEYQYKPEASARMAAETGQTPAEQQMVYEDKRAPRNGIIAQDLERSPAYADAVVETPAGKAVDRDRALSETLAQASGFDKRLRELEAYLKSKSAKKLDKQAKVTPVQPRGM